MDINQIRELVKSCRRIRRRRTHTAEEEGMRISVHACPGSAPAAAAAPLPQLRLPPLPQPRLLLLRCRGCAPAPRPRSQWR